MKKYILLMLVAITALSACKKTAATVDTTTQNTIDDTKIKAYISANNINAIKDPSGLYYQVVTAGQGPYPTATSRVNVNYTGKLLDGTVFDSGNIPNTALNSFIQGWQIGVPHINASGRILLIIPSSLAYGGSSQAKIPANSVLVFTIDLLSFQ